ncbi:Peroxide-responsive repressor PerR [[Clostridium] scindens]|nr:Peroxide-responsive repressor PerR [[Clostridium] scindens]
MAKKTQYWTRQRIELLSYLKSVQGRHIAIKDIEEYFKRNGIAIGTTTIYRHLERMVTNGLVAKYSIGGTGSACFEYIGERENYSQAFYYHCKCEKCGKLIHLQCREIANLSQHMLEQHGFKVNYLHTVFYGICDACRSDEK